MITWTNQARWSHYKYDQIYEHPYTHTCKTYIFIWTNEYARARRKKRQINIWPLINDAAGEREGASAVCIVQNKPELEVGVQTWEWLWPLGKKKRRNTGPGLLGPLHSGSNLNLILYNYELQFLLVTVTDGLHKSAEK